MPETNAPPAPPKPPARMTPTAMPARPQPPPSMPPARQDTPAQPARATTPAATGPRALPPVASEKPSAKKGTRKERVAKVATAKREKKAATKSTLAPVRKAAKDAADKMKPTLKVSKESAANIAIEMGGNKPQKEIDPTKLDQGKATKRLSAIYKLEKMVERKQAIFESASKARRAAKAELEEAQEALKLEIQEQRFGPGPLWNADGSGPAGAPQENA